MRVLIRAVKHIYNQPLCNAARSIASSSEGSGLLQPRNEKLIFYSTAELFQRLGDNVEVRTEFISEEEESAFMKELEQGLRKKRYEFDHWDDVSSWLVSEY